MPAPELWGRFQHALLWVKVGVKADGTPKASATPIELKVRWDNTRRQVASKDGTPSQIDAVAVVDREIPIGSLMWLGRLEDIPGTGTTPLSDVMEVHSYNGVPDLKNRVSYQEVELKRWKNQLRVR